MSCQFTKNETLAFAKLEHELNQEKGHHITQDDLINLKITLNTTNSTTFLKTLKEHS